MANEIYSFSMYVFVFNNVVEVKLMISYLVISCTVESHHSIDGLMWEM